MGGRFFQEIAHYLSNPPSFVICQQRPAVCERNAVFVIDREVLPSDDDLKSDDFSWRNNGTNQTEVSLGEQTYVLIKTYFVHGKYKDFKRRNHAIVGPDGTQGRYTASTKKNMQFRLTKRPAYSHPP